MHAVCGDERQERAGWDEFLLPAAWCVGVVLPQPQVLGKISVRPFFFFYPRMCLCFLFSPHFVALPSLLLGAPLMTTPL